MCITVILIDEMCVDVAAFEQRKFGVDEIDLCYGWVLGECVW